MTCSSGVYKTQEHSLRIECDVTNRGHVRVDPGAGQDIIEYDLVEHNYARLQESISMGKGKTSGRTGRTIYMPTSCVHTKAVYPALSGGWSESSNYTYEDADGIEHTATRTFNIDFRVAAPSLYHVPTKNSPERIERLVAQALKRIIQGGSSPKPPKSNDIGETLGEGLRWGLGITEGLLRKYPPKPRANPKPTNRDPWVETFHPLEIIFAFGPVADQGARLLDMKSFVLDPYFEKLVKWQQNLRRTYNSYGSKTRMKVSREICVDQSQAPKGEHGSYYPEITTTHEVYVTGRLFAKDTTEVKFWDSSQYLFKSLFHTAWDLTSFSYMVDRFLPQIEQLLDAGIGASNSSGLAKNEQYFSFSTAQAHYKSTTTGMALPIYDGEIAGSGALSTLMNYIRTEVDGATNADREGVINVADVLSDFFDDGIPSIGDWTPMQYLDTVCLFVPTIHINVT